MHEQQVSVHPDKLKKNKYEISRFTIDLIMMVLLVIHLTLMAFDSLFLSEIVQNFLQSKDPLIFSWYKDNIHDNITVIDTVFISIYLTEFFGSWIYAVKTKLYDKWFFFPILHFYDLLGSIPLSGSRWLRLFRVVAILFRWQRIGFIDLSKSDLVKTFVHYYNIIMEEITDTVVVNILNGVKEEVKSENKVTERIINEVVRPHKDEIARWTLTTVKESVNSAYGNYRLQTKEYVDTLIADAVIKNDEIKDINRVPIVGSYVTEKLEKAIADIVFQVFDQLITDIGSEKSKEIMEHAIEEVADKVIKIEKDSPISETTVSITSQVIDILIEQVKVQQWKLREQKEKKSVLEISYQRLQKDEHPEKQ